MTAKPQTGKPLRYVGVVIATLLFSLPFAGAAGAQVYDWTDTIPTDWMDHGDGTISWQTTGTATVPPPIPDGQVSVSVTITCSGILVRCTATVHTTGPVRLGAESFVDISAHPSCELHGPHTDVHRINLTATTLTAIVIHDDEDDAFGPDVTCIDVHGIITDAHTRSFVLQDFRAAHNPLYLAQQHSTADLDVDLDLDDVEAKLDNLQDQADHRSQLLLALLTIMAAVLITTWIRR